MSGPEQRPDAEPNKEASQPFIRAARYEQARQAARAYVGVKGVIFQNHCDLSVYRFKFSDQSHVAVLGMTPAPELQQKLDTMMQSGTPADLPQGVVVALFARREQARKLGPRVELRHRPGRRLQY